NEWNYHCRMKARRSRANATIKVTFRGNIVCLAAILGNKLREANAILDWSAIDESTMTVKIKSSTIGNSSGLGIHKRPALVVIIHSSDKRYTVGIGINDVNPICNRRFGAHAEMVRVQWYIAQSMHWITKFM